MSIRDLPDDIEALQAIIREQAAARAADRAELDQPVQDCSSSAWRSRRSKRGWRVSCA